MSATYDVIVLGLGGMGSAAAYHLAARGRRVLGLERYGPAHDRGSSHGGSRIIRQAYFEGVDYVPLVLRAYELWQRLDRDSGRQLLRITGGLMLGREQSAVVRGSLESARQHGLDHEMLDAATIRRRFPPFQPGPDTVALYEAQAGIVFPEASVAAHLERAAALGAELHFEEPVANWEPVASDGAVAVTTTSGRYEAGRLVIAPGAWAPELLRDLGLPLVVERQVQYWLKPHGGIEPFLPERFPIFIWDDEQGPGLYGFPAIDGPDGGVKIALHHGGVACTPQTIDREVHAEEIGRLQERIATQIPDLNGQLLRAVTCMYTNTPDEHFIVGLHPRHAHVALACGFSGHGYKFASVVGEILADLATEGATSHPIQLLDPTRAFTGG
jgi:sarcosine oxidase